MFKGGVKKGVFKSGHILVISIKLIFVSLGGCLTHNANQTGGQSPQILSSYYVFTGLKDGAGKRRKVTLETETEGKRRKKR